MLVLAFLAHGLLAGIAKAQAPSPTQFRIGERITYSVSFNRFSDVAYAEIYTVSRGTLGGRDAVELRSKIKTLNFVSAAFYLIDESRTVFAAPDSGLPLYLVKAESIGGLPKETVYSYLVSPTVNFDLVTLIYKIRHSGGIGAGTIQENEKTYNVSFQSTGLEKVKTGVGEFDTTIVSVQSDYLNDIGVKELKINLTNDEAKVPALIRLKTAKGEFKAAAASIQLLEPDPVQQPTPVAVQTPRPTVTPTPASTPQPYVENQPLAPELSFALGESLEYRISSGGQQIGSFSLQAKERKQFMGVDSLLLSATAARSEAGNQLFRQGDSITAQVSPETLTPRQLDIRFNGALAGLNQTVQFDQATGAITFKGANRVDAPVGTHSILSLLYAMRSFNLKPSADPNNPVNDTRVAVFWDSQPYIFTLRPSTAEIITLQGEKVSAQLVTVTTGNPQLDQLNIKIWLGNDERRLPLRISIGSYQADLVTDTRIQPK